MLTTRPMILKINFEITFTQKLNRTLKRGMQNLILLQYVCKFEYY